MKTPKNKTKALSLVLAMLSLLLAVISFLPSKEDSMIYSKVLRLHVLANSDSEQDQQLKLAVRDAILKKSEDYSFTPKSISQAQQMYSSKLNDLENTARHVIEQWGEDYDVKVSLCREYYPVKSYGNISLPSGNYLSLKVEIGEAQGKNWWCVLYPPICLSAASAEEEMVQAGFTGEQVKIITENNSSVKYKIKFKLLESFRTFFDNIFGN